MSQDINHNAVAENLAESEQRLQELNGQLDNLVSQYRQSADSLGTSSFFNFNNPYFLIVLAGLVLLALGLWFLMRELKRPKPSRLNKRDFQEERDPEPQEPEKKKEEPEKKRKSKKSVKIKVVKVK